MFRYCLKALKLSILVSLFGLVACSDQAVKQDMPDMAIKSAAIEKREDPASAGIKTQSTESEPLKKLISEVDKRPAPLVVEVTPRKNLDEDKISIEVIPAVELKEGGVISAKEKKRSPIEDRQMVDVPSDQSIDASSTEQKQDDSSSDFNQKENEKLDTPEASSVVSERALEKTAMDDAMPVVIAKIKSAAEQGFPVSSGPNHFVVTVATKDNSHPFYGKGHLMGFLVNNVSGKELVIERGQSYLFEIMTNPKHDVYISKKEIGWGSTPLAKGVEGAYTYKGKMIFKPDAGTPDKVFYACRNHPYMGGAIHVINKGEQITLQKRVASTAPQRLLKSRSTVTEAKVRQKIMFAEMMAHSTSAKRVKASQHDKAKKLMETARTLLLKGKVKSKSGALAEALILAEQSLHMMKEAGQLVPSDEELAHQAENYKTKLYEINGYQASYRANFKRLQKSNSVPVEAKYDEVAFAKILSDAKTLAEKKNFNEAAKLLQQAQRIVTVALHKMLDSKTLVYDLNFDTPAAEFEYESKRFGGYEELIPVAIEAKNPSAGAVKLMESFLNKARKRRDEARSKADSEEYGDAIAMMQQATKTVRRALRMVGVSQ